MSVVYMSPATRQTYTVTTSRAAHSCAPPRDSRSRSGFFGALPKHSDFCYEIMHPAKLRCYI